MYNVDSNGKVTAELRKNFPEFISKFSDGKFKSIRVGNESSIHFKMYGGDTSVEILLPIEDIIKSFNDMKKNVVRFNDPVVPGEKSKPSFMTFDLSGDKIIVSASGPNEKNKTETYNETINKDFIVFLKKVVEDYIEIVNFEVYGNKVDANKHKKQVERLEKFVNKLALM